MSTGARVIIAFVILGVVAPAQSLRVWVTSVRLIEGKKLNAAAKRRIEHELLTRVRKQTQTPLDQDGLEDALHECDERARDALQQLGYFKVETDLQKFELPSPDRTRRVRIDIAIEEGELYSMGDLRFTNGSVLSEEKLRSLIPLKREEVFNTARIRKGLENLRVVYTEHGYLNFTPVPDTVIDEQSRVVNLRIDLDEGKQYRIGRVFIFGFSPDVEKRIRGRLKTGDVFAPKPVEKAIAETRINLHPSEIVIKKNGEQGVVDIHIEHPDYQRKRFTPPKPIL